MRFDKGLALEATAVESFLHLFYNPVGKTKLPGMNFVIFFFFFDFVKGGTSKCKDAFSCLKII